MNCSGRSDRAIITALVLVCFGALTAYAQTATFDPRETANQISNKVASKFGSSDGIRQNAVNPMTAGGGSMTNINGTTSFNAPLVICPASKKFLDVSIVTGNTGDIVGLYVQQDTDFDSLFDYAYSAPAAVSGVCGNGVISCDAGTWNNCRNFKWVAGTNGKVGLQEVGMQDLGGCFCVNNSCGNGLVLSQLNYVLSTLGGGVVGAVQAVNSKWAVSNANTVDTTISYYGQNSDRCATPAAPWASGPPDPQQYYGSSTGVLDDGAQSEAASQSARSDSAYSILMNSAAARQNPSEYRTCSIKNIASVLTEEAAPYYLWLPWLNITVTCSYGRDSVNYCGAGIQVDRTRDGSYDAPNDSRSWGCCWTAAADITTVGRNLADQCVVQEQQSYGVPASEIRKAAGSESWAFYDGGGKGSHGNVTVYGIKHERISPPLCPAGYQYVAADVKCYKDTLSQGTSDGCASLSEDPNCRLKEETIDGVESYHNYSPTKLVVLPSCRTFMGRLQNFDVCNDWWAKTRTYLCQTSLTYEFSTVKERAANISNTASAGSGSFSYQDKTPNSSGGWDYSANTVSADTAGGSSSCMTACKTRKPASNTQASLSGTTAQSNVSTSSWEFFYKTCAASVCPVGDGEEILIDCQCIDEFAEAATIMETMNHAAKDLICSNGDLQ